MDNQDRQLHILIADDHELFLQGLEFILGREYPSAETVPANSYTQIFSILKKRHDFDLILTDLAMPGANWRDAIARMHAECPDVPIIIISAVFEKEILQKTYDLGVSGYISKTYPANLILSAINLVLAGGVYIPEDIMQMNRKSSSESVRNLIKDLDSAKEPSDEEKSLTPRQREVLQCLSEGMSNKQIAYKLGVTEGTVKIHITLLMRALDVSNRTAAVHKALKLGILKV